MLSDDLRKYIAWVEYCHWKEHDRLTRFIVCSDSFQTRKNDLIGKIKSQQYVSLQKYLLPRYEEYEAAVLNALENCKFSDSIWIPKSKSTSENTYQISNYTFPKDLFRRIETSFVKRLNLKLTCIAMEENDDYYWPNIRFDYDRTMTMNVWKEGRMGDIFGSIRMFVKPSFIFCEESKMDVVYAVMGFLLRVYLDYLSFSADKYYIPASTSSFRRRLRDNFNDLVKAKDPCLNLIGNIVSKIGEIKKMIETDPEYFTSIEIGKQCYDYGNCPEDDIERTMEMVKSFKEYKVLEEIENNIATIKELSCNIPESKLCQMWNRCFSDKVYTYDQLQSVLNSMFDNLKNHGLELISFKLLYRFVGLNTDNFFLF